MGDASANGFESPTGCTPGSLALVCVGGGSGVRFGGDKLAERLAGRTVLEVAAGALRGAFPDAPLVIVVPASRLTAWEERLARLLPGAILAAGGARRQDSVRQGAKRAAELGAEVVLVHDAARPLVRGEDVHRAVSALGDAAGAVLCQRVTDTVKRVDRQGVVMETLDRNQLRLALTPQVFRLSALLRAWADVPDELEWTDEAAMLEAVGLMVRVVEAGFPNPKLTTRDDLAILMALAEKG